MKKREALKKGDTLFNAVAYTLLTIILLMVLYPLYFVVIASFSDPVLVGTGKVWLYPRGFNVEGYQRVLGDSLILRGYLNSIWYTFAGVLVNLFVTVPAAYALSRKNLKWRNQILFLFLLTMFVSGGMIPTFLVVSNLHLLNTMWALVLPVAMSVYNMVIARTFFQYTIPEELWEAAKMDGCSDAKFFIAVVLPLSKAIIAILVLYYGVSQWNSYYNAMLYITDRDKFPLQLVLRAILTKNQVSGSMIQADADLMAQRQYLAEMIKYALIIVSSLPVLVMYPFLQKYFVKGVMIGSVKG